MGFSCSFRALALRSVRVTLLLSCVASMPHPDAAPRVVDDLQRIVSMDGLAERVVSLAPHLTELVYSAGAGEKLVGVSRHCDYPPAVSQLPKVSDHVSINYELLSQARPDLVLVWGAGLKDITLHKLVSLYGNVYVSGPDTLRGIAKNLLDIATLTGHPTLGQRNATQFLQEIEAIATRYADARTVETLYLLWHVPPMTINGAHWISGTLELCNGRNVFADVAMNVVQINRESLQLLKIDILVHSLQEYASQPKALSAMLGLPDTLPVSYIEDDLIQRPSLRIARSADELCRIIHQVRSDRQSDETRDATN